MADSSASPFAGELLLALAEQGRLTLSPEQADEVIAGLERTLSTVRFRLRILWIYQSAPGRLMDLPEELSRAVVEAAFTEMIAPGRLGQAAVELPKYIEAMRRATRSS